MGQMALQIRPANRGVLNLEVKRQQSFRQPIGKRFKNLSLTNHENVTFDAFLR